MTILVRAASVCFKLVLGYCLFGIIAGIAATMGLGGVFLLCLVCAFVYYLFRFLSRYRSSLWLSGLVVALLMVVAGLVYGQIRLQDYLATR